MRITKTCGDTEKSQENQRITNDLVSMTRNDNKHNNK